MKVLKNRLKAFTIIELIMVITIVGLLILSTTIYLGGFNERRNIIESQGCATTLGGKISNFVFYALTSKNLRFNDESVSPDYYYISLTGASSEGENCTKDNTGSICDTIVFSFSTGEDSIVEYETYSSRNTCHGNNSRLRFTWSGTTDNDIESVMMNKGFIKNDVNDINVFILSGGTTLQYVGDIIVLACINSDCTDPKEISRFAVDGRSQTIFTRNCKFYDEEDPTKCKTREGCTVYNSTDPTACDSY